MEQLRHDLDIATRFAGPLAPFQCHCSQRAEFTNAPFSSAKQVTGNRNTSVLMLAVSTSLSAP
jgi:hypothetical protein